ncbi:MAG: type II toxin-antitoxin system VapC family toxin [Cyanobacteria bacterium P01_F01_bin.143]
MAIYLLDTNVILRFAERNHPLHPTVRNAVRQLRLDGHELKVTSQNCVEFWNVATRPANKNGFGLKPVAAERMLRLIERLFPLLPDAPTLYSEWRRIVVTFQVSGVQVYDARLVAAMKTNEVNHLLTFNTKDFTRYASEGIIAVEPTTTNFP